MEHGFNTTISFIENPSFLTKSSKGRFYHPTLPSLLWYVLNEKKTRKPALMNEARPVRAYSPTRRLRRSEHPCGHRAAGGRSCWPRTLTSFRLHWPRNMIIFHHYRSVCSITGATFPARNPHHQRARPDARTAAAAGWPQKLDPWSKPGPVGTGRTKRDRRIVRIGG